MSASERYGNQERRASARFTVHADPATMQFDKLLNQGQANSRSFVAAGRSPGDAVKTLEEAR